MLGSSRRRRLAVVASALAVGSAALLAPSREAHADQVNSTGKGITGGALLGGEVVVIIESIAGVTSTWPYIVGGLAGAAGGGIGGYFVEQNSSDGRAPMYMLAGGMALIIPAVVLTLNATRYQPEEGATEENAPTGPAAEPGTPGGSVVTPAPGSGGAGAGVALPPPPAPAPSSPSPSPPPSSGSPPPQSLLDVRLPGQATLRLGIPIPDVRPVFSLAELRQYGFRQETELRMPVLHVTF
jgi:hypothetical protein